MEKCLHPLIWGPQRAFPVSDPLAPVTSLTWACPGALAPFGPFQQDFSQLPLPSRGGTQLQPCPAQRQNSVSSHKALWSGGGGGGQGQLSRRNVIMWENARKDFDHPAALFQGNIIFLALGEAIFMMDNKSPEIMLPNFCEVRESHVYT